MFSISGATISNGYPYVKRESCANGYLSDSIRGMSDEQPNRKHSQGVLLRFEPEQLELMDLAAGHAGLNRSGWMRSALLRVAREEVEAMGAKGKRKKTASP